MTRILLADENDASRAFLHYNLSADGYVVRPVKEHGEALRLLRQEAFGLVICDLDGRTLPLLDALRAGPESATGTPPEVPVVMLARSVDAMSRLRAFERGADEFCPRPVAYRELRARIANLLRRTGGAQRSRVLDVGPIRVDLRARTAAVEGRRLALTAKEWELLALLAARPGRVVSKEELLIEVWNFRSPGRSRTVDSHACRLRAKLAAAGADGLLNTVWGVGYRLDDRPEQPR